MSETFLECKFYITNILNERIADSEDMAKAVYNAYMKFLKRDWGNICLEDKEANNEDLKARDGHVLARYNTPEGDIYINMHFEGNENIAVAMFCYEY